MAGSLNPSRRRFVGLALTGQVLLYPSFARAAESALPIPVSLPAVAREAAARGEPLVLLVSLPGCPFCELVRRNYLLPMRAEGLAAWQINTHDRSRKVVDFAGKPSSGAQLAAAWQVRVTPTVLFLDSRGTEIAPRLEGIAVPDFYGAYLDDALAIARRKLVRTP